MAKLDRGGAFHYGGFRVCSACVVGGLVPVFVLLGKGLGVLCLCGPRGGGGGLLGSVASGILSGIYDGAPL